MNVTSIRYLGRDETGAASLLVRCHRGTYVRSLARDLGRALGAGAHLSGLRRLCVGCYRAEEALPYNPQAPAGGAELAGRIQSVESLASQYYSYDANAFCEKRLGNGLGVYVSFMRFRNPGVVPVDEGVMVVGKDCLCLGALRVENDRAVVYPQANIPKAVRL